MPTTSRPRSIIQGTDQDCLRQLLELHAAPKPHILDVTYGKGALWRGLPLPEERLDVRALTGLTCRGDFRALPTEWTARFDVVVFDPPHFPEIGARSRYADRFGATEDAAGLAHAPDITHLFAPFLREAKRVLRPNGIILAKLIDIVHRGAMRWQVWDFVDAARGTPGLTPCDRLIRVDEHAATLTGHNWQRQYHLRRADCFWVVVRKGRCRRPDAHYSTPSSGAKESPSLSSIRPSEEVRAVRRRSRAPDSQRSPIESRP